MSEVETKWRNSNIFEMDAKLDINLKSPPKGTLKGSYLGIYNGNISLFNACFLIQYLMKPILV